MELMLDMMDSAPRVKSDSGGMSSKRKVEYLVEVRKSDRILRKPVRYVDEVESEVKAKEFKRKVVDNNYVVICGYCDTGLAGKEELREHLRMGNGHKYRCKVKQDMEMVGNGHKYRCKVKQ